MTKQAVPHIFLVYETTPGTRRQEYGKNMAIDANGGDMQNVCISSTEKQNLL